MKTLVVLAALAALALAAPSLPESSYRYIPAQYRQPGLFRRDKKSTQALSDDTTAIEETSQQLPRADIEAIPEARTFLKKRPIIIKKKLGYHLYRDSEEERAQADPTEKCNKQVRFKFCDAEGAAKSSEVMRSSIIDDADSDVKQSIKMAKTALENLQKMSQTKHAETGSDAELHDDIEIARQALEHIQKNFGNVESMNLRATTLSEAEALQDAQFQIADTEEEKMAQWKEAIENIQKNAEIARNIEDSLHSENQPKNLSEFDETVTSTKLKHADPENNEDIHKISSNDKSNVEIEKSPEENLLLSKNAEAEQIVHDEMATSASEPKEMKAAMPNDEKSIKSDIVELKVDDVSVPEILPVHDTVMQEKQAEPDTSVPINIDVSDNIKNIEQPKASAATENKFDSENSQATSPMKTGSDVDQPTVNREADKLETSSSNQHLELEKSALKGSPQLLAKSVENSEEKTKLDSGLNMQLQKSAEEIAPSVKSVESSNQKEDAVIATNHGEVAQQNMKAAENTAFVTKETNNIDQSTMLMKSADHEAQPSQQITNMPSHMEQSKISPSQHEISPELRTADHPTEVHQLQEPSTLDAVQARNWHSDTMPSPNMKTAEQINFDIHNPGRDMNMHRHTHLHNAGLQKKINNIHLHHTPGTNQFRPLPRNHEQLMGKSADMDSAVLPSMQMNVEADSGKAAQEKHNALGWKQDQAARGAYGAYGAGVGAGGLSLGAAAGATGAVGVFPNANVGGCAIPLLLSCSPSVVSGSLASSHTYGAPAYRAGDKFKFHNKRETDKVKKLPMPKVKRTPTRIIEKIPYVLDKKL